MDAALAANTYNCRRNSTTVISANLKKYVEDTLAKTWNALSFLNDYTDGGFFKLRLVHDKDYWKKASHYKIINGQKVESGWMSQIKGITADTPNKIRGDRCDVLLFEELGSWADSVKAFILGDALVGILGAKFGIKVGGGTGGDEGPKLKGLKTMFYDPEAYDILPFRNNYNDTGEYRQTAFFIPAYTIVKNSIEGTFMDNRGYTDPEKGKEYYDKRRAKLSKNPEDLLNYCAEYCYTPEEAFILEGTNKFNKVKLAELLTRLRLFKEKCPKIESGYILYTYSSDKHTYKNISGFKWVPDINGKVRILEHPLWTLTEKLNLESGEMEQFHIEKLNNLYVAGIDGIDIGMAQTSEYTKNPSLFCIIIYKRVRGLDDPMPVAVYKDRPNDIRDAYKIAMCLAQYYNAMINIEATRMSMVTWARGEGLINWFMKRPRATLADTIRGKTNTIGTPATLAVIDHLTDLIRDYIEDYCQNIWFEDLLEELTTYSIENKTSFDMVASLGMVMLADEEIQGIIPKQVEVVTEVITTVGYYFDDNGYKRWGIVELKPNLLNRLIPNYRGIKVYD